MALVSIRVSEILNYDWYKNKFTLNKSNLKILKPEDTYMCVFNTQTQSHAEAIFNTIKDIKVLYKSPCAVNKNHGDLQNRNTLYIFELK